MRARVTLICLSVALTLVGCGARLTEAQRLAGIGAIGQASGGPPTNPTGGPVLPGQSVGPTVGPSVGPGGTVGPSVGPSATAPGAACTSGDATDTGVTADEITIATVSDISGVQPGLFKSTHEAVRAVAAYINSLGGICGRQLTALQIDSKTDSTGNRAGVLAACDKAFALVGSVSAFDDGGADAVDQCKIPDITALTTNLKRVNAEYTYPVYPNRADYQLSGPGNYIKKIAPGAIKNAGMLYLNAAVAKNNAEARIKAYEKFDGYNFVYTQVVQLADPNYSSYVVAMKNHDPPVKYVDMVGNYQSIAQLLKAMRRQNWYPEVLDFDSVVYAPGFHAEVEGAGEGLHVFFSTAMIEEASENAEMQLYTTWLQRVAPGAVPDYFGIYAWSAGRLFAELAGKIGAKLTREALMTKLRATHSWGAFGLHATHDIGNKMSSPCFLYAQIKGTTFEREAPKRDWICNMGPLVKTPT
jgi:ABC-type branched-subunit amino acid transport system substrate-binding protein